MSRLERRSVTVREHTLPPMFRVPLSPAARQQMAIIQLQLLADVHNGVADESTLWDMVRNGLTWSRVAELVGAGQDEMADYLTLVTRMVLHYGATGRVEFTDPSDDTAARLASAYMEDLAELATLTQARLAANWSEARVLAMQRDPAEMKRGAA